MSKTHIKFALYSRKAVAESVALHYPIQGKLKLYVADMWQESVVLKYTSEVMDNKSV